MNEAISDECGWVIRVRTERLDDGEAMVVLYAAAFGDPGDAEDEIRAKRATPNENVEAVASLSRSTRDRLGLRPGDVWML